MNVELTHQSDEYSSLIDPDLELNSFHIFIADSTALAFSRRASSAPATKPDSSDSTTWDKLSVKAFACSTKSLFKVRLTGRLRAAVSQSDLMAHLRHAHSMHVRPKIAHLRSAHLPPIEKPETVTELLQQI
jgi:hypothetical protein